MAAAHPDLEAEQAYIDRAYECLEATREAARKIRNVVEVGRGGTLQARFEREVFWDTMVNRLAHLQLGDQALCFGRIDTEAEADAAGSNGHGNGRASAGANGSASGSGIGHANGNGLPAIGDSFYIGRIAVSDEKQEPMIVDWRAPVAEPFYRATGREPMGLVRRRHFATRGRSLLNIEDELFGDAAASLGLDGEGSGVTGHGALISALETARSGKLGDIVATIQGEQDEIIRSDMAGVLVVQGGPGTGKTVVALHRAAYLLYTFRFPLEDQGVLVVGPNRLFLSYIDQVLPSLGEAGVELAVLADLVPEVTIRGRDTGTTARIKGDERMLKFLIRAVRQRERALREDLVIGYGVQYLTLTREQSKRIVSDARRRFRRHNAGRRHVESEVYATLARSSRDDLDPAEIRERFRGSPELRETLEWMWPVLTPAQLLHDLYGSKALLKNASSGLLTDDEWRALYRPRSTDVDSIVWTDDDAPMLDEARALLGVRSRPKRPRPADGEAPPPNDDEVRTYGHIVVDEAQDLSPMQLQMLTRRSLNGSMTIVGDIAQATGQWAHQNWEEILEHLPDRKPAHRAELTIGYRLPKPIMDLAGRVLRYAAPELEPPDSVREEGDPPRLVGVPTGGLAAAIATEVRRELDAAGLGNVAVICPGGMVAEVGEALDAAGIEYGQATRHGLDVQVTVVPVGLVKGLEVDASVVVEPARIVADEVQGLRSLYVALTRATKRLVVVHEQPLPSALMA
jgi:DNA helicase IV